MIFQSQYADAKLQDDIDVYSFLFEQNQYFNKEPVFVDAYSNEVITFQGLKQRVNALAKGFHNHGISESDIIGIYSPNHLEYPLAIYAALRIGACLTPANPSYTVQELNNQLLDSNTKWLITIPDLLGNAFNAIQGTQVKEVFVFGNIGVGNVRPLRSLEAFGELPAIQFRDFKQKLSFLCYSSGTTGKPKGVETTHYNSVSNILQIEAVEKNTGNIWCDVLPMYHMFAQILFILLAPRLGVTTIVHSKFDFEVFLQSIEKYQVTDLHVVPPMFLLLAKSPLVDKYNIKSLKSIMVAAAPTGKEMEAEVFKRVGMRARQAYGMTELSPCATLGAVSIDMGPSGTVGRLIPNTVAKVVDPTTGKLLGIDQEGEIWIKGPQVMKGYLNRPDATAETIDQEGFLHTGDIGKVDKQGFFFITDRLKELIKVKGMQVAPAELEAIILTHPLVADCAVLGINDERAGELPKAYVTLKPGNQPSNENATEIIKFVENRVAPFKRLKGGLEFIDAIPKSPSGKILRRILKDKHNNNNKSKL